RAARRPSARRAAVMLERWRELRAGLIALAIVFGLVDGCPLPPRASTPAWERSVVEPLRDAQRIAETPVRWIPRLFRVNQQWSLYQAPSSERYKMWIEGQGADRAWRVLYRAGEAADFADAALPAIIEHARVWGTWDPTVHPPGEYAAFCAWVTAR